MKTEPIRTIKALIAVRSGSERVPNKNIRRFADSTLLEIKIKQLKRIRKIGLIHDIVVNSDSKAMIKMAEKLGCDTVERDSYYSSSEISMSEVYKNMAENMDCNIIVYTNVTNPLVSDESIMDCIDRFTDANTPLDSVNTCSYAREFLWDTEHDLAVNYNPEFQPRSQDLPDYVKLNFAINIISREDMISRSNVVGDQPYFYVLNEIESIDIDTEFDFEIAEYVYKTREYLKRKYGKT